MKIFLIISFLILTGCKNTIWEKFIDVHTWKIARSIAADCAQDIIDFPDKYPSENIKDNMKQCMRLTNELQR
jgi:hypothetical protein